MLVQIGNNTALEIFEIATSLESISKEPNVYTHQDDHRKGLYYPSPNGNFSQLKRWFH